MRHLFDGFSCEIRIGKDTSLFESMQQCVSTVLFREIQLYTRDTEAEEDVCRFLEHLNLGILDEQKRCQLCRLWKCWPDIHRIARFKY